VDQLKSFLGKNKESDLRIKDAQNNYLTLIYYAGFAWQKSGQIRTQKDWENIVQKQAQIIANPLEVKVK